jgi:CheY-like chemotaxis protein
LLEALQQNFPATTEVEAIIPENNVQNEISILVVEDNKMNMKVICTMLANLGYKCDTAVDGYEGFQKANTKHYDIIFMDVRMPEMDGLTATRQICQEFPPELRPRIVAMTADAMQEDQKKCLEAGMDDYIAKPLRLDDLRRVFGQCQPLSAKPSPIYRAKQSILDFS